MCREFGLGMGLGSCRVLLDDHGRLKDFDVRSIMGDTLPLYANLGIAQIEQLVRTRATDAISSLVALLQADGLIIHVNPLQEWLQPEGDRIATPPVETIARIVEEASFPVVVKEVGQGMGPASLQALLRLPVAAVELAAHGGTNFAMLELLRSSEDDRAMYAPLAQVGHDALQMISFINGAVADLGRALQCKQIIISGGLRGFLDGYYLMNKLNLPSVYGHASEFLKYARDDYETLRTFAQYQIEGLKLAHAYLNVR
jgi:isopentenyl-diphosphate delta-isomerase